MVTPWALTPNIGNVLCEFTMKHDEGYLRRRETLINGLSVAEWRLYIGLKTRISINIIVEL